MGTFFKPCSAQFAAQPTIWEDTHMKIHSTWRKVLKGGAVATVLTPKHSKAAATGQWGPRLQLQISSFSKSFQMVSNCFPNLIKSFSKSYKIFFQIKCYDNTGSQIQRRGTTSGQWPRTNPLAAASDFKTISPLHILIISYHL